MPVHSSSREDMKATGFVGSPIRGGNVDLLVDRVLAGAADVGAQVEKVFLNDLQMRPCQSCGIDNHAGVCRIDDDMRSVHSLLVESDLLVLGTPVYFDTVSAQMKLMIDRANCMTPLVSQPVGPPRFVHRSTPPKRAILVAVAGPGQQFRTLRVTVKGFLAWVGAELVDEVLYTHATTVAGAVRDDDAVLKAAFEAGARAAS
jgi:NAD(P)H-dependent FMN reductase